MRSLSFIIPFKHKKKKFKKEEIKNSKIMAKVTKNPLNKNKNKLFYKKSQEIEIRFSYNFTDTTIQTQADDKMKDIINKFARKTGVKRDNVVFLYNGNR